MRNDQSLVRNVEISSSVNIPSAVIRCPKNFTCFWNNAHFFTLNFSPAVVILYQISSRFLRCSSKVLANTIMSSTYTRQVFQCIPLSTRSISRSKVAAALQSPNCITLNCHNSPFALNAVFSLSLSTIYTCQYPLCRSNVENHFVPASVSRMSSILGSG